MGGREGRIVFISVFAISNLIFHIFYFILRFINIYRKEIDKTNILMCIRPRKLNEYIR